MSNLDDLEKLNNLKKQGILTNEEFEEEKKKILNNNSIEIREDEKIKNSTDDIIIKSNISNNRFCNNCGNELLNTDKFCLKCGKNLEENINFNTQGVKNKKSKVNILIIIIAIIVPIIIVGILLITILSFSIYKVKNNKQVSNNIVNSISNSSKDNQLIKQIDIKLYDIYNEKPSVIELDNTTETGAIYNITKEDVKSAIDKICKKNNLKFTENKENNEKYYGIQIELNKTSNYDIALLVENNKTIAIMINETKLKSNNTMNSDNKIINEFINELFEEKYANNLISTNNELSESSYRYINNTIFIKANVASILSSLDNNNVAYKEIFSNYISSNIIMLMPISQDNSNYIERNFSDYGIYLKEDKMGTKFKGSNSVTYIKFTSDTEFEIIEGDLNSEASIKHGTYKRHGNKIKLNVTYDSDLEPGEYTGITEPFKPYETEISIIDSNTLQYTNSYGATNKFKK